MYQKTAKGSIAFAILLYILRVGLQYICYTVAYPEQEGEEGKTDGNQTENLPLGGGAELQKKVVSFAYAFVHFKVKIFLPSLTHYH